MHVGFIGFGMIGGSIARAIRANAKTAAWAMGAWSPTGAGPQHALEEAVIDRAADSPQQVLADADLVVLAGPATACLEALDELAGPWRAALPPGAVITDVASTKAALLARADSAGLRYVGGHPMAGLETSGYPSSRADLFADRPWVIVPGRVATTSDIARVTGLVASCRGRVVRLNAADHDRAVAGISHLPLVVAAALVEAVAGRSEAEAPEEWAVARQLAANGWRDMTRLARGDPEMGGAIVATNSAAVAERLRALRAAIDAWLAELERPGGPDEAALVARLRETRDRLEAPA